MSRRGKIGIISILAIQAAVIIYTFGSVSAKIAGSNPGSVTVLGLTINALSLKGYFFMALELFCLFLYAILWQQIIKRYELSVVYANRAFAIFWTFLWSIIFFHEKVRTANVIGILLVFSGIMIINTEGGGEADK